MDHKKDQEFEQTLAESELLLRGAARSASDDADLTLESILAEFGSREDGAEAAAEPEDVGLPEPRPAVRIGKTAAPAAEPPGAAAVRAAGGAVGCGARAGHRESAGGA